MDASDAAKMMGRLGGLTKSGKKAAASRRNGKLGGRPRKVPVVDEQAVRRAMSRRKKKQEHKQK